MSKKSKSEAKTRRAANKRSVRAANKLRWAEYAGKESNRKKKTNQNRHGGASTKHTHPYGHCGNIGCTKCSQVAQVAKVKLLFTTSPPAAHRAISRFGIIVN